jgi:hypothetical protein
MKLIAASFWGIASAANAEDPQPLRLGRTNSEVSSVGSSQVSRVGGSPHNPPSYLPDGSCGTRGADR